MKFNAIQKSNWIFPHRIVRDDNLTPTPFELQEARKILISTFGKPSFNKRIKIINQIKNRYKDDYKQLPESNTKTLLVKIFTIPEKKFSVEAYN
jgi:hypothetical protein